MKNALLPVLLVLMVVPARAHDHQWHYDRSVWEADLARARALVQFVDCDDALLAEARRQFVEIDQRSLSVHLHGIQPVVPTRPALPRTGR
jgi:hypothetical protein